MRPAQVLRRATEYLDHHGVENPERTAEILLASILGLDRAGIYARSRGLTDREARMFGRALCQRCAGTPLQHLTGDQPFRGMTLHVRPGVFIPRPETEVLVDVALEELGGSEDPVVVDVGTGTGAVALAIKRERPGATVYATDLSSEAVELATANAQRLGIDVTVLEGDLLDPVPDDLRGWVDLIVSNPPYVTRDEYASLPVEVRADPEDALVGGTAVHRRLAGAAMRWLGDGGVLAMEIGSSQGDEVSAVLDASYASVRVTRDLADRDRVVSCRRP